MVKQIIGGVLIVLRFSVFGQVSINVGEHAADLQEVMLIDLNTDSSSQEDSIQINHEALETLIEDVGITGAKKDSLEDGIENLLGNLQQEVSGLVDKMDLSEQPQFKDQEMKLMVLGGRLAEPESSNFGGFWLYAVLIVFLLLVTAVIFKCAICVKKENRQDFKGCMSKPSDQEAAILEKMESLLNNIDELASPNLSLPSLSKKLGTNTSILSRIINQAYNENFSVHINRLRVEKFCELILLPENKNYTIESVAGQVGFKSKSTFNKNFKQIKEITPSEFIRSHRS